MTIDHEHTEPKYPEIGRTTRICMVKLTQDERVERGRSAATAQRDLDGLTAQAKSAAATFKEKIEAKTGDRQRFLLAVDTGEEQHEIACTERIDYQGGTLRVFRLDTGAEITEARKALPDYDLRTHVTYEIDWARRTKLATCKHSGARVSPLDQRMTPEEITAEEKRRQTVMDLPAGTVRLSMPSFVWDELDPVDRDILQTPAKGVKVPWSFEDELYVCVVGPAARDAVLHQAKILDVKVTEDSSKDASGKGTPDKPVMVAASAAKKTRKKS